jgi:osmotically-inducible protein OsmY
VRRRLRFSRKTCADSLQLWFISHSQPARAHSGERAHFLAHRRSRDRAPILAWRVQVGNGMENLDNVIEREVNAAIAANRSIGASPLNIVVNAGVVKLSGIVQSPTESLAAEQEAFGIPGVIDVINDLDAQLLGGTVCSDADIAHAVRHALVWNPLVPDEVISSNVTDGIIRLHGTVDDATERDEAERSVCHLPGVRRVHNLIAVRPSEETARAVAQAIGAALDRDAEAEARRIKVNVREGRVTLSGVVRCAAERDAAVSAAEHSPGVRAVTDRLRVAGAT